MGQEVLGQEVGNRLERGLKAVTMTTVAHGQNGIQPGDKH